MGGTFDPIHFGHLLMAEEARQAFALDQVAFVPNGNPPHKNCHDVSSSEDRYAMTLLGIGTHPCFICDRVELERVGPSYTIDTVQYFRGTYPDLKALYFILGADAIQEITTWHEYKRLLEECSFIAVNRPGVSLDMSKQVAVPALLGYVESLTIPGLDISSTQIRKRVQAGQSIRYLTPEPVEAYIRRQGLYLHGKDSLVG